MRSAPGATGAATSIRSDTAPKRTRLSSAWVGISAGLVALLIVSVFALQNLESVEVTFFSLHWYAPLAVLLLLVTALGGIVVFAFGAARIVQLRIQGRYSRQKSDRRSDPV